MNDAPNLEVKREIHSVEHAQEATNLLVVEDASGDGALPDVSGDIPPVDPVATKSDTTETDATKGMTEVAPSPWKTRLTALTAFGTVLLAACGVGGHRADKETTPVTTGVVATSSTSVPVATTTSEVTTIPATTTTEVATTSTTEAKKSLPQPVHLTGNQLANTEMTGVELATASFNIPGTGEFAAHMFDQVNEGTLNAELDDLATIGHWPGTALPGEEGNMVLAGHRTVFSKPFYNIDKMQVGDSFTIGYKGKMFTYTVTTAPELMIADKSETWDPSKPGSILEQPKGKQTATVYACGDIKGRPGGTETRVVVRAELTGTN